jgi:hypothetical protein
VLITTIALTLLIIVALTLRLYQRTKALEFVIGSMFLWYWSLWGSVLIASQSQAARTNLSALGSYIRAIDSSIGEDPTYTYSACLYALFVVSGLSIAYYAAKRFPRSTPRVHAVPVSHVFLLVSGAALWLVSTAIYLPYLQSALADNRTAYYMARFESGPLGNTALVASSAMVYVASIGAALAFSGRSSRFVAGVASPVERISYVLLLAAQASTMTLLGNRSQLLGGSCTGLLIYLANTKRARLVVLLPLTLCLVSILGAALLFRTNTIHQLSEVDASDRVGAAIENGLSALTGAESFSAHVSMYAVMANRTEVTYGHSFTSLLASVIPRNFWPDRPGSCYEYYASQVGIGSNIGFTIHHATGWYLNFGVPGVLLGGCTLGAFWAWLYNGWTRVVRSGSQAGFRWKVSFATMTGLMPMLVRQGPEGYKSLIALVGGVTIIMEISFRIASHRRYSAWSRAIRKSRTAALLRTATGSEVI